MHCHSFWINRNPVLHRPYFVDKLQNYAISCISIEIHITYLQTNLKFIHLEAVTSISIRHQFLSLHSLGSCSGCTHICRSSSSPRRWKYHNCWCLCCGTCGQNTKLLLIVSCQFFWTFLYNIKVDHFLRYQDSQQKEVSRSKLENLFIVICL